MNEIKSLTHYRDRALGNSNGFHRRASHRMMKKLIARVLSTKDFLMKAISASTFRVKSALKNACFIYIISS